MNKYCNNCNELTNYEIISEIREFVVKEKTIKAKINITKCVLCGEEIFNRDEEIKNDIVVFDAYKKESYLLTSYQVKEIRESIGLSQKGFAQLLGFGEKTITRYENGAIQDVAHDNLIRLFSKKENLFEIWSLRKYDFHNKLNEVVEFALQEKPNLAFEYNPHESIFNLSFTTSLDFHSGEDKHGC